MQPIFPHVFFSVGNGGHIVGAPNIKLSNICCSVWKPTRLKGD